MEITNKIHHSSLDSFQSFLINKTIISIVKNSSIKENEVSCIKCHHQVQFPDDNKQTGVSVIGVIVALIQIIPRVLNIFDHTKFPTHISYFFFIIAVNVVANSGKLVPAAIIVAPIAHCDIPKCSAINTAESTTVSEASTKSHKLATSLDIFSNIIFDHFFLAVISDSINSNASIQIYIQLKVLRDKDISKDHHSDSICKADNITVHINKYTKFFIFGRASSVSSSLGASFLIHKNTLYATSSTSNKIPFHL